MDIEIKKIVIKNFKNLKNVEIYPRKFNVIVGRNGSGKTNFVEFFKLLRKIYIEQNPYPFLEWDGYENVVWNHDRSLPIEFEIETNNKVFLNELLTRRSIRTYKNKTDNNIEISINIRISSLFRATQNDGLEILEETINFVIPEINFNFSIINKNNIWIISINNQEFERITKKPESLFVNYFRALGNIIEHYSTRRSSIFLHRITINFIDYILRKFSRNTLLDIENTFIDLILNSISTLKDIKEYLIKEKKKIKKYYYKEKFPIVIPPTPLRKTLSYFSNTFLLFRNIITLFSPAIENIKHKPKIFPIEEPLKDRGENALDILAQFQFKEGKIPERIEYFVDNYFNGRIYFKGTGVGRLNLYFSNGRIEIPKEHLPDGLIKGLILLTALELDPSILIIDEIENSLHAELIEFLISVLKEGNEGYVFITTHSPVVLDLVDPEDILIFKLKEDDSVEVKNVTDYKSKEELKKELEELGIRLSEKVMYGLT